MKTIGLTLILFIAIHSQNYVFAKKKVVLKNDGGIVTVEYKKRKGKFSIELQLNNLKGSESENKNISLVGVKISLKLNLNEKSRYQGYINYFGNDSVFSIHDKDFILANGETEMVFSNVYLFSNRKYSGYSKPELNGFSQILSFNGSDIKELIVFKDSKSIIVKEAGYEKYPGWEFSTEQRELFNKFLSDYIIKDISPDDIF